MTPGLCASIIYDRVDQQPSRSHHSEQEHQHLQEPPATRATDAKQGRTSPLLPDIPSGELSLDLDLKAIVDSGSVEKEDSAR